MLESVYLPLWVWQLVLILKGFSDETCGDFHIWCFDIVWWKMCLRLEECLCNSVNQYFRNGQCTVLHSHAWIKDPFRMQGRPMGFSPKHLKMFCVKFLKVILRLQLQQNLGYIPRPMDCNVRVQRSHWQDFRFHVAPIFRKLPLVKFWYHITEYL